MAIGNVKDSFGHILLRRHLRVVAELLGHFENGPGALLLRGWGCALGTLGGQRLPV